MVGIFYDHAIRLARSVRFGPMSTALQGTDSRPSFEVGAIPSFQSESTVSNPNWSIVTPACLAERKIVLWATENRNRVIGE